MTSSQFHPITDWVSPGARVLDLGCGDGTLLAHLRNVHRISGYGLEIDIDNIVKCMAKGVNAIQADLDHGLADFRDLSFDTVILLQTLQAVRFPGNLLREMLRVGREGVVTFQLRPLERPRTTCAWWPDARDQNLAVAMV